MSIRNDLLEQILSATSGGGSGGTAVDNLTGGWANYQDLATQTTLVNIIGGAPAVKIPNDGLGGFTIEDKLPIDVTRLYNTTTEQIDVTDLNVGDMLGVRFDIEVTTSSNSQEVQVSITFAIGSPSEFTVVIAQGSKKLAGSIKFFREVSFAAFNSDFINYPAELKISSDDNCTLRVFGYFLKVDLIGRNSSGLPSETTGYTHITPSNWEAALPSPVGDVITLTAGAYYFDGYVDISPNRLFIPPFDGIVLRGETSLKDTLVSNCIGGAMIGGDNVLLATRNLSLEAGAADDVLAITGSGSNLIMSFTDFFDYKNMVSFTDGTYFLYDNGFTTVTGNSVSGFKFFGTPGIVYFTHVQAQSIVNTWIDLGAAVCSDFSLESAVVGVDNTDPTQLIIDGLVDSGNISAAKGGIGRITDVTPQDSTGTPHAHYLLGNILPKDVRWDLQSIPDVINSKVFAENQSENSVTATALTDGVWSKIVTDSPVLSPETQRYFSNGTDLEYSGLKTTDHNFTITMSVKKSGGSVGNYEFAIFKNANADATTGTKISVILPMELKNTAQLITFSTSSLMSLGDFVGIYIRPVGTSDNVVVGALASQIHG